MFEPVTMTRAASAADGVGAAPMSVDSGGRFCANAFDAIMRGIPTQAPRVMRRNPNLDGAVLVIVSPLVRLALRQRTRKNFTGWQDYFSLFEIFLNVPLALVSLRKATIARQAFAPNDKKVQSRFLGSKSRLLYPGKS